MAFVKVGQSVPFALGALGCSSFTMCVIEQIWRFSGGIDTICCFFERHERCCV